MLDVEERAMITIAKDLCFFADRMHHEGMVVEDYEFVDGFDQLTNLLHNNAHVRKGQGAGIEVMFEDSGQFIHYETYFSAFYDLCEKFIYYDQLAIPKGLVKRG